MKPLHFLKRILHYLILALSLMFCTYSCFLEDMNKNDEDIADNNHGLDPNVVYPIAEEDLEDWDSGVILNANMYLVNKQDSLATENLFLLKHIENDEDTGLLVKYDETGRLLSILYPELSFFFYYDDDNTIKVTSVSSTSIMEEFTYSGGTKSGTKGSTETTESEEQQNVLQSAYQKLDRFLNDNADKLATSNDPYLRMYAEELRKLPDNLVKNGASKLITELFGKRVNLLVNVLMYFDDLAWKNTLFGNCDVSLQSVRKEGENHYIHGTFENYNQIPGNGALTAEMVYGFAGKKGKSYSPDIYYNDFSYNWKATLNIYDTSAPGSISIDHVLPKLEYGWYRFRAYMIRAGVVRYCGSLLYFNPELDTTPSYTISNVECRALDNSDVEFSFDCTLNPLSEVQYQGLQLYSEDGTKIADLGRNEGMGSNSQRITKSFNKSQLILNYDSYSVGVTIQAKYWYVPFDYNKTLYLDLNSTDIADTISPRISFSEVAVTSNDVIEYDDDGNPYRYETHYSFKYNVKGSLWFDTIQYVISSDSWTNNWDSQTVSGDGEYSASGIMHYGTNYTPHTDYYVMFLHNGTQKRSSNSLVFGGSYGNVTASIGGAPAYQTVYKVSRSGNNGDLLLCSPE